MDDSNSRSIGVLLAGDGLGFLLITLAGFANHERLSSEELGRMLATFLPFYGAWLAIIPWLGLFRSTGLRGKEILWRVPLAAVFAASLGGWLRGLLLNAPIMPVFILVMASMTALTMSVWRIIAVRLLGKSQRE